MLGELREIAEEKAWLKKQELDEPILEEAPEDEFATLGAVHEIADL